MSDVLTFDNVSIEFVTRLGKPQRILDQVSFSIASGEAMGLVGESGCGKSTAALAALRYLPRGMRISAGRVLVDGKDLAGLSGEELRHVRGNRIAMVYQDPMSSLNPVMTIGAQLVEVPLLHGETSASAAHAKAVKMLGEVRIPDPEAVMTRYPHQLSGGQQQRVVIAMALMAEPALLLMDEPTTGLDVTVEAAILELVRDLRGRFGAAILFISHNLGTIARICDRIGVLYAGRLVETGPIRQVFEAPSHPYTRGLMAALPRIDGPGRGGKLSPIEGVIAAGDRTRVGCAFSPRCPIVQPSLCDGTPIAMVPLATDPTHLVRCVRLDHATEIAAAVTQAPDAGDVSLAPVLLDVQGLQKNFPVGKQVARAVVDASFQARAGQTLAIVGESGCGKSTLARVLSGLFGASGGAANFAGVDLANLAVDQRPRDLRRRIQMVFQNPDSTLNPSHSIEFTLMRPLRVLRGLSKADARAEVGRLMEVVRLAPELRFRTPDQLSGGQRQRVAIARALAGEPDLVIADEPVSALDVSVQAAILNLLAELLEQSKIGLVVISHDLALVRHMAHWVAVMYLGRVVEYGPADQVFAPPFHPYTAALLAAAPKPSVDDGPPGVILGGTMPSPTVTITGCAFANRCPHKLGPICDTTPPPIRRFGKHQLVCHLEAGTA